MSDAPALWLNSEKVAELAKRLTPSQLGSLIMLAVENVENGFVTKWSIRKCEHPEIRRMFFPIDGERYNLGWLPMLIQKTNPYAVAPGQDEKGGGDA